jgi:hypothetical protein
MSDFVTICIPIFTNVLKPLGMLLAFCKFCPPNGYLTTTSHLNKFK